MTYQEIEFKYDAKNIQLTDFKEFCEESGAIKKSTFFGSDTFYFNNESPLEFYRYRQNHVEKELTYKRKTDKKNSFVRTELNLQVDGATTQDFIDKFLTIRGFTRGKTIYKTAFVSEHNQYTAAYYICYDVQMNELGRFIEIEVKEGIDSEQDKVALLNIIEKKFKVLGILPKNRLTDSLFEMYGK